MRLRKPRKLGLDSESVLRQEILGCECIAATCLYLVGVGFVCLEISSEVSFLASGGGCASAWTTSFDKCAAICDSILGSAWTAKSLK